MAWRLTPSLCAAARLAMPGRYGHMGLPHLSTSPRHPPILFLGRNATAGCYNAGGGTTTVYGAASGRR